MFARLLLLFTLLPLVELILLAWFSAHTDWRLTVLFVVGTGVIGAGLVRWQGWRTWRRIQDDLAHGNLPADALQDGLLILVAGVLLITPGVLTDAVGVLLLLPPVRRLVKSRLRRWFKARFEVRGFQDRAGSGIEEPDDKIIDVKAT
ncbi:MAG TPA: FxsA family protein [Pirellulales bacterium]|nr:FxsA family protein [Pirellulales bacterium]